MKAAQANSSGAMPGTLSAESGDGAVRPVGLPPVVSFVVPAMAASPATTTMA